MTLKRVFWILTALFVPTVIALARIGADLPTVHAPQGIVSFEFCGFAGSCPDILEEWGGKGREAAMLSLGLDYLFMLIYAGALWAGLTLSSEGLDSRAKSLVRASAAGALVAGLADAAENFSLIKIIAGGDVATYGLLASTCATVKFGLVVISLLVWAGLGIRRVVVRRS